MFDVNTVIGQRMVNSLDWLDEADVETTVTCCNGKGDQVKKKCGGRITASCKDVFRKGGPNMCVIPLIMFFSSFFAEFDNAECSADLFRTTNIWTVENVCPAPKIWMPGTTCKHKVLPSLFRGKRQSMTKNVNITKREHVPHKISALMLRIVMRTNFTRQKRSVKGKTDSAAWSRSSGGMPNAWEELRIFRLLAMNVAFNTGRGQKELMH